MPVSPEELPLPGYTPHPDYTRALAYAQSFGTYFFVFVHNGVNLTDDSLSALPVTPSVPRSEIVASQSAGKFISFCGINQRFC
jgi:hypothetical protein